MASHVPQRENWNHDPAEMGELWTLREGDFVARCAVWSHVFGHEVRLMAGGELLRSQVWRSTNEILDANEQWRAAMVAKGWM
jgi:hypothetical protein